jgi:hypothetical protein
MAAGAEGCQQDKVRDALTGILVHELTHAWQLPWTKQVHKYSAPAHCHAG